MFLLKVATESGIAAASTASTGLAEIASDASTGLGKISSAAGSAVGAMSLGEVVPSLMLGDAVEFCHPGLPFLHELFDRGAQVCREFREEVSGCLPSHTGYLARPDDDVADDDYADCYLSGVVVHSYGQPSLMLGDSVQPCHPEPLSLHKAFSFFESSVFYGAQACRELGQHVSSCLPSHTGYLVHFATHVVPALSTFAGVYCALRYYSVVGPDDDVADDDYARRPPTGTLRFVAPCMKALSYADCFLAGVVVHSFGQPFAVTLQTYAIGSLFLGFPTTLLVDKVVRRFGIRRGFLLDVLLAALALVWQAYGTWILAGSPPDVMNQSPLLFWSLFIQIGFTWAAVSSLVIFLMLMTAAAAIGRI